MLTPIWTTRTHRLLCKSPELKSFHPDANQDGLPVILDKTGMTVNEFFQNFRNVIAREKIIEQKFTSDLRVGVKGP
jgi:hypothetical protein